jgi:cytochrome P450
MRASGTDALDRVGITEGPFREWRALSLNARDREDHRRLRLLVGRAFTPMQVQRVRPLARENAERILDELAPRGEMEVQADYARDVPLFTICAFLGIPDEDRHEIEALHFGTEEGFGWPMTPERRKRADDGILGLYDYTRRLVERRRAEPRDDLVTALVHVEAEGDRLSEPELYAMVVNLIGGAIGSSQSAIANAAYLFTTHPDQADLLAARPTSTGRSRVPALLAAVPLPLARRSRVEVAGLTLQPGDAVLLSRGQSRSAPSSIPIASTSAGRDRRIVGTDHTSASGRRWRARTSPKPSRRSCAVATTSSWRRIPFASPSTQSRSSSPSRCDSGECPADELDGVRRFARDRTS